jgi:hypothetical protein
VRRPDRRHGFFGREDSSYRRDWIDRHSRARNGFFGRATPGGACDWREETTINVRRQPNV